MPGSTDVNELYDQYIAVSEDVAFNNALIDLADAVAHCVKENNKKSDHVEKVVRVFQVQVGLLAAAIAWSGLSAIYAALTG